MTLVKRPSLKRMHDDLNTRASVKVKDGVSRVVQKMRMSGEL